MTPFEADNLGFSTAAIGLLRDLVHEQVGVHFDASRLDALADRLAPLVAERRLASFLDYYYFLKYDPSSHEEWARIGDALAVPETYFWREVDQLRAAVDIVIPDLVARARGDVVRIWSVPCASGEEPLTLAMLLDEAGWFGRARIEIHGGDVSPAALDRARRGEYRERSFRSLPARLRDRYFSRVGEVWRVAPELHARVHSWHLVNLMRREDAQKIARAPLVFCRNVFIYFSPASIGRVVDMMVDVMPTPGYLCVAASESLLRITSRLELEAVGGAFMYVKRAPRSEGAE